MTVRFPHAEREGRKPRTFLELTVPKATSVRVIKGTDHRPRGGGVASFDGVTENDRWLVTNPCLPATAGSSP